ncbi:MAG TPA: tRNA uridine-5-carboxymethylaminomethyl(34) synthesis GTPase MnmE [Stellaceae bacterium]
MEPADTIFAPATAPGRAGVAVVRISGPASRAALLALGAVDPARAPRLARLTAFADPATGEILDRGLAIFFPAPASFTGEDVAELHLHGSRAVLAAILGTLAAQRGLRFAEPGEFTRRAFENGKLDLTEAEGLADLVEAETAAQRRQALRQMGGELGRMYDGWRHELLRALAHLEADIDFPEEDLPGGLSESARRSIETLVADMEAHLRDGRRGERLRDGIAVAIVGAPNAGKSTLLNALARREAAITSATAGTTRDVIEVHLDLGGYPVILADTAGIRDTDDPIEMEGVRRARAVAANADLRLIVIDATAPPEATEEGIDDLRGPDAILVVNKVDLAPLRAMPPDAVAVSVRTGQGMPALLDRIEREVASRFAMGEAPAATRERHRRAVEETIAALRRALKGTAPELVAEDVRLAVRALGRITGRVDVEEILDVIFRDFCIGK